jgi:dihydrodipicolinate synthase/N-acetylneuraminate lyase
MIAATLTPMDRNAKPALDGIKDYAKRLVRFTNDANAFSPLPPHLRRLAQSEDDCAGVFVCGTSGESMSLTIDERKAALEAWIKHKGSLRVIAQVGTTRSVELFPSPRPLL